MAGCYSTRASLEVLRSALKANGYLLPQTAKALGVSVKTLQRALAKHGSSRQRIIDEGEFVGTRHGRNVIVAIVPGTHATARKAVVRCDCGTERTVSLRQVVRGDSTSCGCYRRENTIKRSTKHGRCGSVEYTTWTHIKARCYNPKTEQFRYYGGAGIVMCERWRLSFEAFLGDMGPRPPGKYTIDRINPHGNYDPSNCRWATWREQANNKRKRGRDGFMG